MTLLSSSFHFRQRSEKATRINLPLHAGPMTLILLWEIIKLWGDRPWEISYGLTSAALVLLWIQAWKTKLVLQSHFHWKREWQVLLGMRLGEPSHLWRWSEYLWVWLWFSLVMSVRNSSFKFRIVALMTGLPYGKGDQSHIKPPRRDALFNCSLWDFFWPKLCRHIQVQAHYRYSLSHLYIFLTDKSIS